MFDLSGSNSDVCYGTFVLFCGSVVGVACSTPFVSDSVFPYVAPYLGESVCVVGVSGGQFCCDFTGEVSDWPYQLYCVSKAYK